MTQKQLEQLGFTKNESSVYTALLEIGCSTSGKIIEKTGIHSSKVYASLERLKRKNLVNYVIKSGKKSFIAADPSKILKLEKEREELANSLIPELRMLQKQPPMKVKIEIYQDREGLKDIIDEVLGCKRFDILASLDTEEIFPHYSEYISKQIKKKRIYARLISSSKVKEEIKEHRFFDQFLNMSIIIFENKVIIIVYAEQISAMIVESELFNKKYKNYFENLWKIARKEI